jgi:soluble lytic murein transglycosylase-like protein
MLWGGRIVGPEDPIYADAAQVHGLDLALVLAIAEVESSYCQAARNPEPQYRYLVDVTTWRPFRALTAAEGASESPPADFPAPPGVPRDEEWQGQQASWGLMQVMGGVARELMRTIAGGRAPLFLGELIADPSLAVDLSCRHLKAKLARYDGDTASGIAAYNAGSAVVLADAQGRKVFGNQVYVDKVTAALARHATRIGGAA